MKGKISVSIIVPVYNKEQYVSECIDSLLAQTYENREIILVDDGSTDESGNICDRYAADNECIRVVHKDNGGPSSAWKAGFASSCGEYIMFVDSDDYIDDMMLEEMSGELAHVTGEMVISDYAIAQADGTQRFVYQSLPPGIYEGDAIRDRILPEVLGTEVKPVSFSRCMKLIERSLIEDNVNWCDDRVILGDDSTIIFPALADCTRLVMMDHKVYYFYRYINDSIVHRYDEKAYENNLLHYEALKRIINGKITDETLRNRVLDSLDREEILQLMLLVKKEVRSNYPKSLQNLRALRNGKFVSNLIKNTPIKVHDKANMLLYAVLKNPNRLNIWLLDLAFKIYYR